jgi:hypothetical protein
MRGSHLCRAPRAQTGHSRRYPLGEIPAIGTLSRRGSRLSTAFHGVKPPELGNAGSRHVPAFCPALPSRSQVVLACLRALPNRLLCS